MNSKQCADDVFFSAVPEGDKICAPKGGHLPPEATVLAAGDGRRYDAVGCGGIRQSTR